MGQQIESALQQSSHRVLQVLANFLPGILALLLALLVFALLGFALAAILRRILVAARFDERLLSRETSDSLLTAWAGTQSPSLFASRIVLWGCVLIGVAVGISAFNAAYSTTSEVSVFLLPYVTHITGAALLLIAGSLLSRFLARSVLIGAVQAQLQYARFLSLGVKWLVLVLTAAMALDHLQIGGGIVELAFGILFGGIVLTLALAIGLGSRDLVTRSIERTMERPSSAPTEISSAREAAESARPKIRHF